MPEKLTQYKKKRNFKKTPEPRGKLDSKKSRQLLFVVQKHSARRLHYDFRLEHDGVLKSWAVPKGPSMNPEDKRLAVMVEDHPFEYKDFEGVIPKDNYGAGPVIIWDEGTYTPLFDLDEGLKKGHIAVFLKGKKLEGRFDLVRVAGEEKSWLLIKAKDEFASGDDILKANESVRSGKTIEKMEMPKDIKPMLATLGDKPFDDPNWIFEIKWDGYRAISYVSSRGIFIKSRKGQDFTKKFPLIAQELKKFEGEAIFDGEIVAVDERGIPRFQYLQNFNRGKKRGELFYYVFDILYLDGKDLRMLPLIERKEILNKIDFKSDRIRISEYIEGSGKNFFEQAKKLGLEGIIAKDLRSRYESGRRSPSWIKIKTSMRQEAVITGFTAPRGSRAHFGALILGLYEKGKLKYIGHTGGGFDEAMLKDLRAKLDKLRTDKSPFEEKIQTNEKPTWVKPELVAEISFQEWTEDGRMRAPIFLGLREDKNKEEVRKEEALGELKLTNLDKVFWPKEGYTKGDLIEYYKKIAPTILPYLRDRPESLHRHPNGIGGKSFFQKNIEDPPDWLQTITIRSEGEERDVRYLICNDERTLIYMANLGSIEINPWNSRVQTLEYPDYLIIDLDPEDISFDAVIIVAKELRKLLEELNLKSFVKTSGARGLHVLLPLGAKYDYEETRIFAELIARTAEARIPECTSTFRSPKKRQKKVYLDFLQNRKGQTLAAPYSLRPRDGAPVSTPLKWEEVKKGLDPLKFNIKTIFKRLEKIGDLWEGVLGDGIDMHKAIDKLEKISHT